MVYLASKIILNGHLVLQVSVGCGQTIELKTMTKIAWPPLETILINEPHRDKTNKMACAPSKDSDQPRHPPSLIRVFAVSLKKARILSYPLSALQRL